MYLDLGGASMTVAYKDTDRCTDIILDFIAQFESAGNYNAVIGNAHARDDLGARTIDQIYALMDQLREAGRPSTAVGRYQIIKQTLRTLQVRLNIAGSDRFTPELQDRLAVELLVDRGYQKWWTGAMTDERFAHAISLEWASLPDPDDGGKSHYDGVGPNHAGTSLHDVFKMLERARMARTQQAAAPAAPTLAAAAPSGVGHLPEGVAEKSPREWIKDIQTILRNAGFYTVDARGQPLQIDGDFGSGSKEALNDLLGAAFQNRI
jgi:muramidase (phage lysozyme)